MTARIKQTTLAIENGSSRDVGGEASARRDVGRGRTLITCLS
jgi:hypothetical protein